MTNELSTKVDFPSEPKDRITKSLLSTENYNHYMKIATELSNSELVPKELRGKPANLLIAMELGFQIGLAPLESIQSIAVINGRPTLWGDTLIALVKSHKDYRGIEETLEGEGENMKAVCTMYRKGESPRIWEFSVEDAKKAGLWKKQGPWTQYPQRMLQVRARTFCARDMFPDALKGMYAREEAQDYHVIPARKEAANNVMDDLINKSKSKTEAVYSEVIESEPVACESVLAVIEMLFAVKGVGDDRQMKALSNYGCETLGQLTEVEAQKLIETLNSFPDI